MRILKYKNEINVGTAGSYSVYKNLLVQGGFLGEVYLFHFPSLQELYSKEIFDSHGFGVQIIENNIVFLGSEYSQSFNPPLDWGMSLRFLDFGLEVKNEFTLGAGNWNLVQNIKESSLFLYDTTEDQGIKCIDGKEINIKWELSNQSFRRVTLIESNLYAINYNNELFIIDQDSGNLKQKSSLPKIKDTSIDSIIKYERGFLLGCSNNILRESYLIHWDIKNDFIEVIWKSNVKDLFSQNIIDNVSCTEEDCGYDLNCVSNLLFFKNDLLIVIGGDGERLSCSSSGCCLVVFDLKQKITKKIIEIDNNEGNSGIFICDNDEILLNCNGFINLIEI